MKVRVLRVLSEDPWRAKVLDEINVASNEDPFEKLDNLVRDYVAKGYECNDYGAASIQLCLKKTGKRLDKVMIGLWTEQIPDDFDDDEDGLIRQLEEEAETALGVLP